MVVKDSVRIKIEKKSGYYNIIVETLRRNEWVQNLSVTTVSYELVEDSKKLKTISVIE